MRTKFSMQEIANISKLTDKKVTEINKSIKAFTSSNLSQAILAYKLKFANGGITKNSKEIFGERISDSEFKTYVKLLADKDLLVKAFSLILPNIDGVHVSYKTYFKQYKAKNMQDKNIDIDIDTLPVVQGWRHKTFGTNVLLQNIADGGNYILYMDTDTYISKTVAVKAVYTEALLTKCLKYFRKNYADVLLEIKRQKGINIEFFNEETNKETNSENK